MKSITYRVLVDEERKTTIALPDDVTPGVYTLRVYVEESLPGPRHDPLAGLPTVRQWGSIEKLSLKREDLYDDQGR